MTPVQELADSAKRFADAASFADVANNTVPLKRLAEAAQKIGHAFSGSWLGYHSRVYYEGFRRPPPGANFSQEWGFAGYPELGHGSRGSWSEFDPEEVKSFIHKSADFPDLEPARTAAAKASCVFDEAKAVVVSILELELSQRSDPFLSRLKADIEKLEPMSSFDIQQQLSPKGQIMTRDTLALGQGNRVPPHIHVAAEVLSIQQSFAICEAAADICIKAGSHLERMSRKKVVADRIGTKVFIGHGRSLAWREVKDFVQDRLALPWDEFNRVPVAGVTNIARLSEMLDAAAIALLVLTAEHELADGDIQARMNVVHEAGLFQGRLGFTRAIVLLEDGCKEFTNVQGLGQIRFLKGQVSSTFEELRRVLEREGLIVA